MAEKDERRQNRITKSKLNVTVAIGASIVAGVFSFLERVAFNRFFISDYLGLSSLFTSIIGMLSVVNLDINGAIAYSLYEPLAKKDEEQICAIIRLYKFVYRIMGLIILLASFVVLPFLKFFVNTSVALAKVKLYFMIFVLRTCLGYFIGHIETLIQANQERYKTTLTANTSWILMYIVQILISWRTQNFLLYCLAMVFFSTVRLTANNIIAKKEFPYLGKYKHVKIEKERFKRIIRNTKGLIYSRVGGFLTGASDSTLISMFVGTATLGCYSNYSMLTKGCRNAFKILPQAVTASLGDAGITESKHDLSNMLHTMHVAGFLIYGLLTVVLINMANPFVRTFFGPDRTLPSSSVMLTCWVFFAFCQKSVLSTFKDSLGLYWENRWRPIVASIINLISSIILGRRIGLNGILIGTLLSYLYSFILEPLMVLHLGVHTSAIYYFISSIGHILLTALLMQFTLFVNSFLPFTGLVEIIAKAVTSFAITVAAFFIIYRKSPEAKVIIKVIKKAFRKKKKS